MSRGKWKLILLLIAAYFAYKHFSAPDPAVVQDASKLVVGQWGTRDEQYADVTLEIDEGSLRVLSGGEVLCDEPYLFDERTLLLTSAYRQSFGEFVLFEYRSTSARPALLGSVVSPDGGHEEILFTKK